jgi:hypothetical protein
MERPSRSHLLTFGYQVLRQAFDPTALLAEFDAVTDDAFTGPDHRNRGNAGNQFRYVPMMCERTPVSLDLVVQFSMVAAELLDGPVLPGRAKATTYFGSTGWHRDAESSTRSVGVFCYLDPLDAGSGALAVVPGSHHAAFGDSVASYLSPGSDVPGVALATRPGDAIVVDERLFHASSGGGVRRQWRVDFVADTGDDDALRAYFAGQFAPGWDGGYDVDRYPSYGPHWRTLDQRWNDRLEQLGAYQGALDEEDAVRQLHTTPD